MVKLFKKYRLLRLSLLMLGAVVLAVAGIIVEYFYRGFEFQAMKHSLIFANMVGSIIIFFILIELLKLVLNIPWTPLAVAKVLMDEVIRLKVPVLFMVFMVILLALLPFMVKSNVKLYVVQSFLYSGLTASYFFIGMITIFLAAGTMNHELEHKLYYTTLVKPIGRATFLFGKWLGLISLNAIMLLICVSSIYASVFLYILPQKDALNENDEMSIQVEVLNSRNSLEPDAPVGDPKARLEELKRIEPRVYEQLGGEKALSLLEDWNREGGDIEMSARLDVAVIRARNPDAYYGISEAKLLQTQRMEVRKNFRTLQPGKFVDFVFSDLGHLKGTNQYLQFKYETELDDANANPHTMHMERVRLLFGVVGTHWQYRQEVQPMTFNIVKLRTDTINDKGELRLRVANLSPGKKIIFPDPNGVELYYPMGSMWTNIFRSSVIMWVQLSFMALLALCLGALFTMPVVVMICISTFLMALGSKFLAEEIEDMQRIMYRTHGFEYVWRRVLIVANTIILMPVREINDQNPIEYMTKGLYVSWKNMFSALLWKGLVWGLGVGVAGWFFFRRRELAKVQV